MNKIIQISNELYVLIFRTVSIIFIIGSMISLYYKEYELVFSFLFVSLFWIFRGNLFKLKSVSFDKTNIYIDDKVFGLEEIDEIKFNVLSNTYVKINNKKYYFLSVEEEFGFTNKRKILEKYKANIQENKITEITNSK